jgi:multicomponent K+:H+ antiporter subunit F
MNGSILPLALGFAILCVGLSFLLNLFRLWRGPLATDRILAVDTLTINAIALIVLFGIAYGTAAFFEAAILLAMVGFVATVAYCKFLLRGDIIE